MGERRQTRKITAGGPLPKWVTDEINRSVPKARREAALTSLKRGADYFSAEKYGKAKQELERAKQAASRSATVREILGLTLYRMALWKQALQEMRAFRRLAGDTTHMAVEIDCLRALDRVGDIEKTWDLFNELGGSPRARAEVKVVYGSFLLDQGNARKAWDVTGPHRITTDAKDFDLRRWYVGARAALALGDKESAQKLRGAIVSREEGFPGIFELDEEIAAVG